MAEKVQGEPGSSRGIRKCKEVLKNENIKRTQEPTWKGSHSPNLGQFKQQIKVIDCDPLWHKYINEKITKREGKTLP